MLFSWNIFFTTVCMITLFKVVTDLLIKKWKKYKQKRERQELINKIKSYQARRRMIENKRKVTI